MIRRISYLVAFCLVSIITASSVIAEERDGASGYGGSQSEIGVAAVAVNVIKGTIETETRNIKVSDKIFGQEIIETNSVSTTQVVFLDETVLTIGPESRLILDEMVFDPNLTKGKVVITAVKGLFTFVSGSLPSESYRISTPTATIGVRGTKFDLFVARNGASTVILRSGAIDVQNLKGITRRIATVGLATSVTTERTVPTPPAPPDPQLKQLFKPLENPGELQGKNPRQVNVKRESIEKESNRKKQIELRREKAKDLKRERAEKRNKKREDKAEKRRQKSEERAEKRNQKREDKAKKLRQKSEERAVKRNQKREDKAEKLRQKRGERAKKRKTKKGKKVAKKDSLGAKKAATKASKGAKKAATKASKGAKNAAKKASKSAKNAAKKASKSAKKAARKAVKSAKKAAKQARKAIFITKKNTRRRKRKLRVSE